MRDHALKYIEGTHSNEFNANDYHIGFHIPLACMIPHLHLHMMIGKISFRGNIEFNRFLFNPIDLVIQNLEAKP
jgi:hypothetical protein